MPKTKNPNTAIRARPACARCGDTGTVAGGAVYPGTGAYRPPVPCPACAAPAEAIPTPPPRNRQQRQLAQRAWVAELAGLAITMQPETSSVNWDQRTGCISYTYDGMRYMAMLTVTETGESN